MSWISSYTSSSVGKKQWMAVSGLLLCGFLLAHLMGNFLLLGGADGFNHYAEKLHSIPGLAVIELILALIFCSHILMGIKLTLENKAARPQGYAVNGTAGNLTFASKTMIYTGVLTILFLLLHVWNFRFIYQGQLEMAHMEGKEFPTLFFLVNNYFAKSIVNVLIYVVAFVALGLHVSHGFQSMFHSMGLRHAKWDPIIKVASYVYALIIGIGFAMIPLYIYFVRKAVEEVIK